MCMSRPLESSTDPCISSWPAQWVRHSQYMFASAPRAMGSQELARQKPSGLMLWRMAVEPFQQVEVSVFQKGRFLKPRR